MGRFLVITILSAFIICLPFKVLAAHDSDDDPLEFDQSGYYKDVQLTVGKGIPLELLPRNLNDSGNIGISLNPEKPLFSAGDLLSFTASVDRDCYLTVMYVSKSGKVVVLWPKNTRIRFELTGTDWSPDTNPHARITFSAPGGRETTV